MIISQSRNPTRSLDSLQPGPWLHLLHVLLSRPWSYWLWSLRCEAFPVTASRCGGVHFSLDVCDAGSHFDGWGWKVLILLSELNWRLEIETLGKVIGKRKKCAQMGKKSDCLERSHGMNLNFQLEVVSRDECGGGVWSSEFRSSGSMERSTVREQWGRRCPGFGVESVSCFHGVQSVMWVMINILWC